MSPKTQLWPTWTYYIAILKVHFIGIHIHSFTTSDSTLVLTELSKHTSKSVRSWSPAKAWCCETLHKAILESRSLFILKSLLKPSELLSLLLLLLFILFYFFAVVILTDATWCVEEGNMNSDGGINLLTWSSDRLF